MASVAWRVKHPEASWAIRDILDETERFALDAVMVPVTAPGVVVTAGPTWDAQSLFIDRPHHGLNKVIGWVDTTMFDVPEAFATASDFFEKQTAWAVHVGLQAIALILPNTYEGQVSLGRAISAYLREVYVYVDMDEDALSWGVWNALRMLCGHDAKLAVLLNVPADLPENSSMLSRWRAEPVKALLVDTSVFQTDASGRPNLSPRHAGFMQWFVKNYVTVLVETNESSLPLPLYLDAIQKIHADIPPPDTIEHFAAGYQDYLQSPLQPLMHSLDASTYHVFEMDPVKYILYENAVYEALNACTEATPTVMVLGAGARGPLVDCCLRASVKANNRSMRLIALEKNPNAIVTLMLKKAEEWGDRVEVFFGDMREWKSTDKADIIVSELLGSFGDNELSPECLDGAANLLKESGKFIPDSYRSYIAPLSSSKLHANVANLGTTRDHSETPYVVMFHAVDVLATPQLAWSFHHGEPKPDAAAAGNKNAHNRRFASRKFHVESAQIVHGIAGYFDAHLFGDVELSILPSTHSPGMFSWFPLFFPLQEPILAPSHHDIVISIWRETGGHKVWYEWQVEVWNANTSERVHITALHNQGGRSSWVGM